MSSLCRHPLWCGGDGVHRVSPPVLPVEQRWWSSLGLPSSHGGGVVEFIGSPLPVVEVVGLIGFPPPAVVWRMCLGQSSHL